MSAQDSLVRLKQLNQPEASGFILAVVFPYLQTGLFGGVNTGTLTGVFYPRTSNPSGYLRSGDLAGYATLSFVSGNNTTIYTYVDSHFYPLASNPSGYITTGQTGNFGSNVNLSSFITTGQTGQFYPSSNPSGFITSAQAGGIQSISITGKNLSGVLTLSGLNGIQLSNSGQIVYISSAVDSTFVRTTGNQIISGNKTFPGALTVIAHGSGTDYQVGLIKNPNGLSSFNLNNQSIFDNSLTNRISLNWGTRNLWDSNGQLVADWNLKYLLDSASIFSIDWGHRNLLDSSSFVSLDWQNRRLIGGQWTISGNSIATGGPYYPLTGNPAGFLTSGGSFYPKTGNPSGYLETTTGAVRHVSADVQFDGKLIASGILDSSTQILKDSSHNSSIDWTNRFMYDHVGTSALAWESRTLVGTWIATNFGTFDVTNSFYASRFDANSLWYLQSLYPNGNAKIQFYDASSSGTLPYISGFNLVNCFGITGTIDTTKVVYTTGNQGISGSKTFGNRTSFSSGISSQILTGTSSTASSIDLNSGVLLDNQRNIVIDWRNYILYGDPTDGTSFDFAQGTYRGISGIKVLEGLSSLLYDNAELTSINWATRLLIDNNSIASIDWQSRNLYDVSNEPSVDYGNRKLNNGAENILDWGNSLLIDAASINSVDWQNRILFDSTQARSIDWNNRILSGVWNVQGLLVNGGPITGNAANTGQLTGVFYPRYLNPSGYITTGQTGDFASNSNFVSLTGTGNVSVILGSGIIYISGASSSVNTGVLTGIFYPLLTNPSGYVTSTQTGAFPNSILYLTGNQTFPSAKTISGVNDIIFSYGHDFILKDGINNKNILVAEADGFIKIFDLSSAVTAEFLGRVLYDTGGIESLEWGTRTLKDTGVITSLDWQKRQLSGNWQIQNLSMSGFSFGDIVIEGQKIFRTPKVSFTTTGAYQIFTVPSGFLFNIDSMEVITTDITSPSIPPFVKFGNSGDLSAYQSLNQTVSNSRLSRHVYDNPQDTIDSGIALFATIGTASTAITHSGYMLFKGYLMRNT